MVGCRSRPEPSPRGPGRNAACRPIIGGIRASPRFAVIRFKCGSIDFSENAALFLVKSGEKPHGMTNRRFNAGC
jgi:hypothetical protein